MPNTPVSILNTAYDLKPVAIADATKHTKVPPKHTMTVLFLPNRSQRLPKNGEPIANLEYSRIDAIK